MVITSSSNQKIKDYIKLKNKKYRDDMQLFLVEGEHLVKEAYLGGCLKEILLLDGEMTLFDVPFVCVSENVLKSVTSLESCPSMIGLCKMQNNKEIIGEKILILDKIQDPGNLGTIIRSAVAFGVDTLIMSLDTVSQYNSKVIRATQGMIFHLNIINCDLKDAIQKLKKKEFPIYGTSVVNGSDPSKLVLKDKKRYALVMGSEGQGISSEISELCDMFLYIPMNSKVESLNVAVATSILLYEMGK